METILTNENFDSLINGDKPMLIDFYADWCGPCRMIMPYIAELAEQTRHHESVQFGISPRGALAVSRAAKAYAYLSRRDYVTADDVAAVFRDVCAHRLVLNTKARMRGYTETDVADEIVSEHKTLYNTNKNC